MSNNFSELSRISGKGSKGLKDKFNVMTMNKEGKKKYTKKKTAKAKKRPLDPEEHHVKSSDSKRRKKNAPLSSFRANTNESGKKKRKKRKKKKKKKKKSVEESDLSDSSTSTSDDNSKRWGLKKEKKKRKRKKKKKNEFSIKAIKRKYDSLTPRKRKKKEKEEEEEKEVLVVDDDDDDGIVPPPLVTMTLPSPTPHATDSAKKMLMKSPAGAIVEEKEETEAGINNLPFSLESSGDEKVDPYDKTPQKIVEKYNSPRRKEEEKHIVNWSKEEERKNMESYDNYGASMKKKGVQEGERRKKNVNSNLNNNKSSFRFPSNRENALPSIQTAPPTSDWRGTRKERKPKKYGNQRNRYIPNLSREREVIVIGETPDAPKIQKYPSNKKKLGTNDQPIIIEESPIQSMSSPPDLSTPTSTSKSQENRRFSDGTNFENYEQRQSAMIIPPPNIHVSGMNNSQDRRRQGRQNRQRSHTHRVAERHSRGMLMLKESKENRPQPRYNKFTNRFLIYGRICYLYGMPLTCDEVTFHMDNEKIIFDVRLIRGKGRVYFDFNDIQEIITYPKERGVQIKLDEKSTRVNSSCSVLPPENINKFETNHFFELYEESFEFLKKNVLDKVKKAASVLFVRNNGENFPKERDHVLRKTDQGGARRQTRAMNITPPTTKQWNTTGRPINPTGRPPNSLNRNKNRGSYQFNYGYGGYGSNSNYYRRSSITPEGDQKRKRKKKMNDDSDDDYTPESSRRVFSIFDSVHKNKREAERERKMESAFYNKIKKGNNGDRILKYKNLVVTNEDMRRLRQERFLNDTIMDFYLLILTDINKLKEKGMVPPASVLNYPKKARGRFGDFDYNLPEEKNIADLLNKAKKKEIPLSNDHCDCHIFNTTFYQLIERDIQRCARRVPDLKIKIFDKKYLFIPINKDLHWTLSLIVFDKIKLEEEFEKEMRDEDDDEDDEEEEEDFLEEVSRVDKKKKKKKDEDRDIMLYCDSLGSKYHRQIIQNIRQYLKLRYQLEKYGKIINGKMSKELEDKINAAENPKGNEDENKMKDEDEKDQPQQQQQESHKEEEEEEEEEKELFPDKEDKMKDEDEEKEKEKKKPKKKKRKKMLDEDEEEEEEDYDELEELEEEEEEEDEKTELEKLREDLARLRKIYRESEKWKNRRRFDHYYPRVEEQTNSSDCGVFVLSYVEYFSQFENFLSVEDRDFKKEKMFYRNYVRHKRMFIRDLIFKLREIVGTGQDDTKIEELRSHYSKVNTKRMNDEKNKIRNQIEQLRAEQQQQIEKISNLELKLQEAEKVNYLHEDEVKTRDESLNKLKGRRQEKYDKADKLLVRCAVKISLELKLLERLEAERKRKSASSSAKKKKKKKKQKSREMDDFIVQEEENLSLSSSDDDDDDDVQIVDVKTPKKKKKKKKRMEDEEDGGGRQTKVDHYFEANYQQRKMREEIERRNRVSKKKKKKKKKKKASKFKRISDDEEEEEENKKKKKKKKAKKKKKKKRNVVGDTSDEDEDDDESGNDDDDVIIVENNKKEVVDLTEPVRNLNETNNNNNNNGGRPRRSRNYDSSSQESLISDGFPNLDDLGKESFVLGTNNDSNEREGRRR